MFSRHIFVATRVSWSSPLISQLLASPVVVLVDENSGISSKSPSDARDDNKSIFFDDNFPADRRTYGRRRRLRLKTDIWTTSRWLSTVVITSCRHYGHHLPTTARSRPLGALATATMTAVPQLLAPPPIPAAAEHCHECFPVASSLCYGLGPLLNTRAAADEYKILEV